MKDWREGLRRVEPYTPGEQPKDAKMIKLNTNENPFPPSPKVEEALRRVADRAEEQRLYPDPTAGELVAAIAKHCKVEEEQVFVGVGSDDVLALCYLTFFNTKQPILFPDLTYSFYPVWANCFGVPFETVPVDEKLRIRAEDYLGKEAGGIIFPNPNAPTGCAMEVSEVEKIVAGNPHCVVIVDEAYVDFGAESAAELLPKYDNLLVVQTFSKSRQMAGMRIGYALGSKEAIRALLDVKYAFNSYTMSRAAIAAGTAAMRDNAYFKKTCKRIEGIREWTGVELGRLGFTVPESKANFLFVTHKKKSAKALQASLRERHIYVRWFDLPRARDYLRITIGTEEQMKALIGALEDILHGK